VMTAHGQNVRAFENWDEVVGLREGDRYLVVGPFSHSFGYKAGFLACLLRGATILPHAVFDVAAILTRISEEKITTLPGAPTIYQSILAHPDRDAYDFSSLRLATLGGAAVPEELVRRMRSELGMDTVVTGYGLTETCGILSMCRYDDDPEVVASSCGRAIDGVELRCVDPDGKEVPRGQPGEVVARGYNLMHGYWDDPEETAATIDSEGWLHTGDVAVMNDAGYLRITDRIKDMYICGGFNVYPAEIENQLFGSGDYAQAAVIGIPDERMGEVGMAFVVPAPGREVTPESVVAWCRANLANYKVPRRVRVVDELPLNASGKVSKLDLRAQAAQEA
jgi:acyl-CoA synthetase (AMP-forming)/AMP-acid ligase II